MKNELRWYSNYETLKVFVVENGHFPGKHTKLNNWCRYQRKRIKSGIMPSEQRILFEEISNNRSSEYTKRKL